MPRYNAASLGLVAQLVEQRIENPRVGGSIPPQATKEFKSLGFDRGFLLSILRKSAGLFGRVRRYGCVELGLYAMNQSALTTEICKRLSLK